MYGHWPLATGYNWPLSKVYERLVSVRLRRFMECRGVLPATQFAYRKGLGTCDALLCVMPFCDAHTLQSALERGQEARIVHIDFSAAFERVNHWGRDSLQALLCGSWWFCVICSDTVSL